MLTTLMVAALFTSSRALPFDLMLVYPRPAKPHADFWQDDPYLPSGVWCPGRTFIVGTLALPGFFLFFTDLLYKRHPIF